MFINHRHYYDWIISWDFNSDGNLIFGLGRSSATEFLWTYFHDVPDVKTGIEESQRAIDLIRSGSRDLWNTHFQELNQTLLNLKHPPPKKPAFDDPDRDEVPF
jgi:hypothetical protein